MLSRIQKINGPAVLKNFSWPSAAPEFSKRNLIYGWNGTGKTSLAEVLRCLETRETLPGVQFSLQTSVGIIRSDSLESCEIPVRVFTRSFVERTVSADTIPGIVHIGSSNVAMKHEIDELTERLEARETERIAAQQSLREAKANLESHCTQVGKRIRAALLGAPSPYKDYDRRNYLARREELKNTDWSQRILSAERLTELDQDRHAMAKPDIVWNPPPLPSLVSLHEEVQNVLKQEVVANAIESLKQDSAIEEWCSRGLELHLNRGDNECIFCGNTISRRRMEELQEHFSASYQSLQVELENLIRRLDTYEQKAVDANNLPSSQEFYVSLQHRYLPMVEDLRGALERYRDYVAMLRTEVESKKRAPMTASPADLEGPPDLEIGNHLNRITELAKEHQRKSATLSGVTKQACQAIEDHHVAGTMDEHDRLENAVTAAKEALANATQGTDGIRIKIRGLQESITPHGGSAKELNRDLERYLGHADLSFEVAEEGYRIVRRGQADAKGLSEGERTAIALLYFLQSLKSDDLDLSGCVVVLDDPVSSLDANALFSAFSFIQEKTRSARQLFILTHSFPFFRLIRRWFRFGEKGSESSFYSLKARVSEDANRYAELSNLDDLLLLFESEYHYLFHLVESAANAPEDQHDLDVYHLPNTARRLLEAFVSFAKPTRKGGLKAALPALDPQGSRAIRILSFTNVLSHNEDFESSSDQDMSSLSEARSVMADVMDFIRETAEDHYEEMMRLLAESRSASQVRGSSLQSRQ